MLHKYGAKQKTVDGIIFPSIKQANLYSELKLLEYAGEIQNLKTDETHKADLTFELQPKFRTPKGEAVRAIKYIGDFRYTENGVDVVEDAKGFKTKIFRMKQKMMLYLYPEIELRIT